MRVRFLIAFFFTLLGPLYSPFPLLYFAPYLVMTFYRYTKIEALWRSCACGFVIDLLSTTPIFGLTSLSYCLATLLLYGQHRNFFEDKFSTLPIMTMLFSIFFTLISSFFTFFTGQSFHFSLSWCLDDLVLMPFVDGIYAFLFFYLPFQITHKIHKMRLRSR